MIGSVPPDEPEIPEIVHGATLGNDGEPSYNTFPEGWTWDDEEAAGSRK